MWFGTLLLFRGRIRDGFPGGTGSGMQSLRGKGGSTRPKPADPGRNHVRPSGAERSWKDIDYSDDGGNHHAGLRCGQSFWPSICAGESEEGELPSRRARALPEDEGDGPAYFHGPASWGDCGYRRET